MLLLLLKEKENLTSSMHIFCLKSIVGSCNFLKTDDNHTSQEMNTSYNILVDKIQKMEMTFQSSMFFLLYFAV